MNRYGSCYDIFINEESFSKRFGLSENVCCLSNEITDAFRFGDISS